MTNKLTAETYGRMETELGDLVHKLDAVRQAIVDGRSAGDIAENSDVLVAMGEEAQLLRRMRQLEEILANATVVESVGNGWVTAGVDVTVDWGGGDEETYRVGSIEEQSGDVRVVSTDSPMGKALLGAEVGQSVSFETPGGVCEVTVTHIAG